MVKWGFWTSSPESAAYGVPYPSRLTWKMHLSIIVAFHPTHFLKAPACSTFRVAIETVTVAPIMIGIEPCTLKKGRKQHRPLHRRRACSSVRHLLKKNIPTLDTVDQTIVHCRRNHDGRSSASPKLLCITGCDLPESYTTHVRQFIKM